ncbi:GntR family transcriptional regulator [Actinomycetospora sp. TBRC 11914]|uniref:GntR family transcriptional regulator n=1 Tax=Actinomycetospora sp. TBRC 11914 TaxID=2729387 RepID=UPI00145E8609|nr:GntR family transcriptional regulator [Actinomycetospora sp. TBRC 11914]NMO92110.1 GntR family transcriptional regulator [Actinomycetospora sp. TBRC 11914]
MARDFASPAYQRIAAEYAEKIDTGELQDGDQLPKRAELAEQWAVSLQVVRDALALLHTDGYLRSVPSKGTYVHRPRRYVMPMTDWEKDLRLEDAFFALVRDQGGKPSQSIRVETVLAGARDVPPGLDLEDGAPVLARRRLRSIDGVPYMVSDSFYPYDLVAGSPLASPADISTGARHVLKDLDLEMHRHRDRIECRRAHNHEVEQLDIAPGVSVIAHTRVSYTEDGLPMRVLASVLPSDRWNVSYEVGS